MLSAYLRPDFSETETLVLMISLVVLQEDTDVLVHLGAHSSVDMWHLQCLAHWSGLVEQDYSPSGPMLCVTGLVENQL